MRLRIIVLIAAALLVTGCSATVPGDPSYAGPATPTTTSPSVSTGTPVPTTTPPAPSGPTACSTLVGKPTADAVDLGASTAKTVVLKCITGADVASDQTVAVTVNCDLLGGKGETAYSWYSKDRSAGDLKQYAGKESGVVALVQTQSVPAPTSAIIFAAGC